MNKKRVKKLREYAFALSKGSALAAFALPNFTSLFSAIHAIQLAVIALLLLIISLQWDTKESI